MNDIYAFNPVTVSSTSWTKIRMISLQTVMWDPYNPLVMQDGAVKIRNYGPTEVRIRQVDGLD